MLLQNLFRFKFFWNIDAIIYDVFSWEMRIESKTRLIFTLFCTVNSLPWLSYINTLNWIITTQFNNISRKNHLNGDVDQQWMLFEINFTQRLASSEWFFFHYFFGQKRKKRGTNEKTNKQAQLNATNVENQSQNYMEAKKGSVLLLPSNFMSLHSQSWRIVFCTCLKMQSIFIAHVRINQMDKRNANFK